MKLTMAQKKGIKTWLEMDGWLKQHYCPFAFPTDIKECLDICPELFPKLKRRDCSDRFEVNWCPCQNYTLAHVIRVARKAVEG